MDIRIFDQPEDLNQVRLFAAQLTHAVTLPTQHWSWAEAFAHTVAHKCELRFIVALEGGRALALLPLVRQPTAPHFELLNLGHLYEPVDVVCMDPTALRLVAAALAERHDLFLFHRVPANSPLVGALREETLGLGLTIGRPDAGWPSIALADQ